MAVEIVGMVDKKSGQAAWIVVGKDSPIMEAGIANLPQEEVPELSGKSRLIHPGTPIWGRTPQQGLQQSEVDPSAAVQGNGFLPGLDLDVLEVLHGQATLAGELAIALAGGFQPQPFDEFVILTASAGYVGQFATSSGALPSLGAGLVWNINDNDLTRVVLQVLPLTFQDGDFDMDGDVDGADFLIWQRGGVSMPPAASDLAA